MRGTGRSIGGAATVERHRLIDVLGGRFRRRLTLVVAGAGFGKTTLLTQALGEDRHGEAAIDAMVAVPRAGLEPVALVAALGDLLRAGAAPIEDTEGLCAAVWSFAPRSVCLTIDDLQWLEARSLDIVSALIEELPGNGHLVLASRADPDLAVHRLIVSGDAVRLGEPDLAFDVRERDAYAALHGIDPTDLNPSGWPALIELERLAGRHGAVRYLVEEVLADMDADRLHACRQVAVHAAVDAATVRAATGADLTPEDLLHGVPLTAVDAGDAGNGTDPLGAHGPTLRVHELVREALLDGLDRDEREAAAVRVGDLLVERGDHDAALDLYVDAGRVDRIRSLARRLAAQLHFHDTAAARRLLIGRLRMHLGDSIEAQVVDAVAAAVDDPRRALALLEAAAIRARAVGDDDLDAACTLQIADIAYSAADLDRVEEAARHLDSLARRGCESARRTSFLTESWTRCLTDRHAEVITLVDERRREIDPASDPELDQLLTMYRVLNLGYCGHVRAALEEADRLGALPGGLFANRLAGFTWIQRWQLGQLSAEDRERVLVLVHRIEEQGQVHLYLQGAAAAALFHASAGEVAEARRLVERAEHRLHLLPEGAWAHHSVAQAQAALALLDGDEERCARILLDAMPARGIASLPRFIYGATAALSYLLVPSTRPVWDADDAGPDHLLRREVGRALVAIREQSDPIPAAALPWEQPELLRPWAIGPHLAELAVAALEAGAHAAERVLDGATHDPHATLTRIASTDGHPAAAKAAAIARALPRRPEFVLEVAVLGPIELRRDGAAVTDERWLRRQRVQDLLALLVDLRAVDRAVLVEMLWPDKAPGAGASNLRYTLSQLNAVLEPDRDTSDPSWFVRSAGSRLELAGGDRLVLDVARFEAAARAAVSDDRAGAPRRALEGYRQACDRYRGEYLSGTSDPGWGFYEAIRLRGIFLDAATRATELLTSIGELDEAEALAVRAATTEPMHEGATTALAGVLLARHRLGAARQVLGSFVDELRSTGLTPEPSTIAMGRRLGVDLDVT